MQTQRHNISILTGTGGTATQYTGNVSARILSIHYLAATADALAATAVIARTGETTTQTIWSEAATGTMHRVPRQGVQTSAGAGTATTWTRPSSCRMAAPRMTVAR